MSSLSDVSNADLGLPFAQAADRLREAVRTRRIAVVEAPPGTGKTTLAPPLVAGVVSGRVIVTQPRRVAARAAARRLASLTATPVGDLVGFSVRGESAVGRATRVEMVTPGVLLRRLLQDPSLPGVDAVILDEVHERNLDTDLLVALLSDVRQLREDLVVVAMSATLDAAGFAALLGGPIDIPAPIISVPAASYPLRIHYRPGPPPLGTHGVSRAFLDHVSSVTREALEVAPDAGDVLIFLPGTREVRAVAAALRASTQASVYELHGQLTAREQDRAITRTHTDPRRIIVSTDLAESSLTVDGVRIVIDAGLSREPRRDASRGMSGLVTLRCAKSSADQRAGRAARQAPGEVWRCYDQHTYSGLRPEVTPEITTGDLTGPLLTLAAWGAPRGESLSLPTPLPALATEEDEETLRTIGAVDRDGRITLLGRQLSLLPLSPRWAKALVTTAPLAGSKVAAEVVAAAQSGVSGDMAKRVSELRRGHDPAASRWRSDVRRLERLIPSDPGVGAEPGVVLTIAFPERVARLTGGTYLLASGTRAVAPPDLEGSPWLAIADVQRVAGSATAGTGALIRAGIAITSQTALLAESLLSVDRIEASCEGGKLRARRITSLGAIELSSTPVGSTALSVDTVRELVASQGLEVIGWSADASRLRNRMAMLHRLLGGPWPDVGSAALLSRLDEWLGPDMMDAARTGWLSRIDLAAPLRRLLPWPAARRFDELAPERIEVPSGSTIRLDYPAHDDDSASVVAAVKLQECFGLAHSPHIADGKAAVVFHLLSPARRPLAITADLASFWSGPYAQVRAEMRGRYPKHPWPEDPWTATATARTNRRT